MAESPYSFASVGSGYARIRATLAAARFMRHSSGSLYDRAMLRFLILVGLVVGLALALTPPAVASEHNRARDAVRSGQILPLRTIAAKVRSQYNGKVLDVRLNRRGDPKNWRYTVKVLRPNGRVVIVNVRARDAQILGVR